MEAQKKNKIEVGGVCWIFFPSGSAIVFGQVRANPSTPLDSVRHMTLSRLAR